MDFPSGYGSDLLTLDQVRARHRDRYHPEAWRRSEAIMVASAGLLGLADHQGLCGIGGGARTRAEQAASYARNPSSFAPPDSSFHQEWEWGDGHHGAQAIDWVGRDGRHHEAWRFLRDHGGLYGLRTFHDVNSEPWHTQMVDVPLSVSQWRALGKPGPGKWTFPGGTIVTPPPPVTAPAPADYGLYPFNKTKPTLQEGSRGELVVYLQRVVRDKAGQQIVPDGEYGPKTAAAVENVQAFVKLKPTGITDRATWDVIDVLAGYVAPPAPPPEQPDSGVLSTQTGLYYVRPGDSPWAVAQRIWGNGGLWKDKGLTVEQFAVPRKQITIPALPGRTTKVKAGEGPYQVIHRLFPEANQYALLDRFSVFNGGSARVLHAGDAAYLPNPL